MVILAPSVCVCVCVKNLQDKKVTGKVTVSLIIILP